MAITGIDNLKFFSGVDINKIVEKQKEVLSKVKINPIEEKAKKIQEKNQAVLEIAGLVDKFKSSVEQLFNESAFQLYDASVSNENVLSVRTSSESATGVYYIKVDKIAKVQQIVSNASYSETDTVLKTGEEFFMMVSIPNSTEPVSLSFKAGSNMTLDDFIEKINEEAQKNWIPIRASKIPTDEEGKYRILITTTKTGEDYKIAAISSGENFKGYVDLNKDGSSDDNPYIVEGNDLKSTEVIAANTDTEIVLHKGEVFEFYVENDSDSSDYEKIRIVADDDYTLDDLIDAINSESSYVSAESLNEDGGYKLKLNVNDGYSIKFINSYNLKLHGYVAGATSTYTTIQNSQDAKVFLGDSSIAITSPTNEIENVIPGTTLELKERNDNPVTIIIRENKEEVKNKLRDFVKAYNDLIDSINKYASYDIDSNTAGPLFGDSGITLLKESLFNLVSTNLDLSTSKFHNLFQIGLSVDSEGHLEIEEYRLDYLLNTRFEDVKNLFMGKTTDIWISKDSFDDKDEVVLDEDEKFGLEIGNRELVITAPSDGYTLEQLVNKINEEAKIRNIPVKASIVEEETDLGVEYKLRIEGTKGGSEYQLNWIESDNDTLDGDNSGSFDIDDNNLTVSINYLNIQRAEDALIDKVISNIDRLTSGETGVINLIQSRYERELDILRKEHERAQEEIDREIRRLQEEFLRMEKIKSEMLSLQNTLKSYFKVGDNND